jgi:hypothetical protein
LRIELTHEIAAALIIETSDSRLARSPVSAQQRPCPCDAADTRLHSGVCPWLGTDPITAAPPLPSASSLWRTSSDATLLNEFVDVARDKSYEFPEFHEGESPRFDVVIQGP